MKKQVQVQLLELLADVKKAVSMLPDLDLQVQPSVLGDCGASLGLITDTLQEGVTPERFGVYETILEQITSSLVLLLDIQEDPRRGKGYAAQAVRELDKLIGQLTRERELRYEVVFVPYKVSMWDALESIWEKATADPRCDVYVVPAPYYDRTNKGTFGAFHYEGDRFEANVPVTYYEDYDFATRCPDVIYLHNPYDAENNVTSVDPRFYSSELKKYTRMLVYVPYFVSSDTPIPYHCALPAVKNADRVILQSQKQAEWYCKYSGQPVSKFLPLGSPKFDKVLSLKKESCTLPEAWRQKIQNKKVILYNTALAGILDQDPILFEKLKYVFTYINQQDDFILWWRPHPLSRATAASRDPKFYQTYCEVEDWYREQDMGIFDDTPEMERAIAFSDVYYGDPSSLVLLYQATGKPVMIQNRKLPGTPGPSGLDVYEFTVVGDWIYFATRNLNGLFRQHLQTGKIEHLGMFPGEENIRDLYNGVTCCENKLFFAPGSANEVAIYDLETNTFTKLKLPANCPIAPNSLRKFQACFCYKERLFITGLSCPAILEIDKVTLKIEANVFLLKTKSSGLREDTSYHKLCLYYSTVMVGNKLYTPMIGNNQILVFDMDTRKSQMIAVASEKNQYSVIAYDGKMFWLMPLTQGTIVCWNGLSPEAIAEVTMPEGIDVRVYQPASILVEEEKIIVYFSMLSYTFEINRNTYVGSLVHQPFVERGFCEIEQVGSSIVAVVAGAQKNQVCTLQKNGTSFRKLPMEEEVWWHTSIEQAWIPEIRRMYNFHKLCSESTIRGIEDLLPFFRNWDSFGNEKLYEVDKNHDGRSGERVHTEIMRQVAGATR